jgi:hypothetical protein
LEVFVWCYGVVVGQSGCIACGRARMCRYECTLTHSLTHAPVTHRQRTLYLSGFFDGETKRDHFGKISQKHEITNHSLEKQHTVRNTSWTDAANKQL